MTIKRRIAFKNAGLVQGDDVARMHSLYAQTGVALKFRRVGKKIVPWVPRPGYVYSQVRAISARINQNYDAWPSSELKKAYKTFIGKPIFVNHTNEDPTTARGVVIAARYVEKGADKYVECIMETDAKRFPKLGKEIKNGGMDSVSMGVEAGFTICSVCENRATDISDMCNHIKFHKGEFLKNKKTGKKILAYENCFKLGFFELSYVFDPADETAVVSRVISAAKKSTKAEAHYRPGTTTEAKNHCGGCTMFRGPNSCTAVEGAISSAGVCDYFKAKKTAGELRRFPTTSDEQWSRDQVNGKSPEELQAPSAVEQYSMPEGHTFHIFPPNNREPRHEWVHTYQGQVFNHGNAPDPVAAKQQAIKSYHQFPMKLVQGRKVAAKYPPAENSQRTQIPGTLPTYGKAQELMDKVGAPQGRTLDYGAGRGLAGDSYGMDTFEPHPRDGFLPTYGLSEDIPDASYDRVHNHNVLNVVSPKDRSAIVKEIGRVMAPGGHAVITTRGSDVLKSGGTPGPEPMSVINSDKQGNQWYQKGFTRQELHKYVQSRLGHGYSVSPIPLGPAGVMVVRNPPTLKSGGKEMPFDPQVWFKRAFGETEAPEDVDTLRKESEDDTDLFHHWVQSPPELRAPDMDDTKRLDRDQETEGLDQDRHAEDAEPIGAPAGFEQPEGPAAAPEPIEEDGTVMPINPPEYKKGRRTKRSNPMSRYYYAADDDGSDDDSFPQSDDSGADDSGPADDGGSDDGGDSGDGDDIQSLLDEAEQDIEAYEGDGDNTSDFGGGDDDGSDDGSWGDDDGDEGGDFGGGDSDDDGDEDASGDEDGGDSAPPWADKEAGTVRRRASRGNRRGGPMRTTLASRNTKGRHFTADESGNTDGGPYGVDDSQGLQEEVFISQVPGAEAVAAPTPDDAPIANSPGNLVAAYQAPRFDPAHYQKMADTVAALPPQARRAVAQEMVRTFQADNRQFNAMTFYKEANVPLVKKGSKFFFAEDLKDPCEVDPSLSGTDVQDVKGKDFESLALENTETQPKDASIHAFRQFDSWLQKATGRTAAQHGNANYIARAAASYCKQSNNPQAKLATLFPTMEYVLQEARKVAMRKSAEDTSMTNAAPQDRIDVEAPVKNVTDEKAQASQFDLGDFAHNAGDQLADPVLDVVDGNAGTWAPDEGTKESSRKLAGAVEAMRCAEAYVRAMPNTYKPEDRWRLAAMFEGKLRTAVRAELRLLEAVLEDQSKNKTARKVSAAGSRGTRGIPRGLGSGSRTASTQRISATDPADDGALFF